MARHATLASISRPYGTTQAPAASSRRPRTQVQQAGAAAGIAWLWARVCCCQNHVPAVVPCCSQAPFKSDVLAHLDKDEHIPPRKARVTVVLGKAEVGVCVRVEDVGAVRTLCFSCCACTLLDCAQQIVVLGKAEVVGVVCAAKYCGVDGVVRGARKGRSTSHPGKGGHACECRVATCAAAAF